MTTLSTQWPYEPFTGLFSPSFVKDLFEGLDYPQKEAYDIKSDYPYDLYVERNEDKQIINYVLEYALSGFKKEDISVKVVGNELRVNVNQDTSDEVPGESVRDYLHKGIAHRNTRVSFKLGSMVDKKKIAMEFNNGLLTINIPIMSEETVELKFK